MTHQVQKTKPLWAERFCKTKTVDLMKLIVKKLRLVHYRESAIMLVIKQSTQMLACLFITLISTNYCFANEPNKRQETRYNINRGISLYKEGRINEALPYLEDVINSGIVHPNAHYVLGEIYYARNELKKAIDNWKIAQHKAPKDAILTKITKAKKELKLDEKLSDKISCNFILKHDHDDAYSSELVLHSFVNVYNELAYDFGWYNNCEFTVILYSNEDFVNILDAPPWAAAIYDGKIRIPLQYTSLNIDELEEIIRHELIHAILHRIAGNNVPAWLHEGIAQYKDGADNTEVRNTLRDAVVNNLMIPINHLKSGFVNFKDNTKVRIAYAESLGFVEYLVSNYGFYTILDILNNFNNYSNLDELFTSVYSLNLNQLENSWIATMTPGGINRLPENR